MVTSSSRLLGRLKDRPTVAVQDSWTADGFDAARAAWRALPADAGTGRATIHRETPIRGLPARRQRLRGGRRLR